MKTKNQIKLIPTTGVCTTFCAAQIKALFMTHPGF
jgi:hypothetical protein